MTGVSRSQHPSVKAQHALQSDCDKRVAVARAAKGPVDSGVENQASAGVRSLAHQSLNVFATRLMLCSLSEKSMKPEATFRMTV